MVVTEKVVVVTGGGNGIGAALCRRFAAEGAKAVVVADIDDVSAQRVAREIGGLGVRTDVTRESDLQRLAADVAGRYGGIDLFCSNAGIAVDGGEETPDSEWQRCWDVNVMAHVLAARAVLPGMLARGEGYLLQTVSAAGLLTHLHSATYAVTKHASLAFAEWLAMAYGDRGIRVSALCPQGRAHRHAAPSRFRRSNVPPRFSPRPRRGCGRRREGASGGAVPHPPASGGRRVLPTERQ